MSTTTTSGTRQRITKGSSPFAPGAIIAGKQVERWFPLPSAAPVARHLDRPLRWARPRYGILTNDLFDGSLSNEEIAAVFGVMAACPQHTFQILTKRPEQMRPALDHICAMASGRFLHPALIEHAAVTASTLGNDRLFAAANRAAGKREWPLPNVWLGVSVENQATADDRIPLLLQTPAAKRFVSYEPALGPVDFKRVAFSRSHGERIQERSTDALTGTTNSWEPERSGGWGGVAPAKLDWVIVGGESGPGARPFDIAWARSTVEQCKAAGVACFVKQMGARPLFRYPDGSNDPGQPYGAAVTNADGWPRFRDRKGGDWAEWPEDLRVREFPH